jgi:hypothetical protein
VFANVEHEAVLQPVNSALARSSRMSQRSVDGGSAGVAPGWARQKLTQLCMPAAAEWARWKDTQLGMAAAAAPLFIHP